MSAKDRIIYRLALFAVAAAFVVIALGAFTRLVDAGLGCPDWPTCYGHVLWPQTDVQVETANSVFNETPVEMHKTWPEQVHRLFASSLGLISLVVFFFCFKASRSAFKKPMLAIVIAFMAALIVKIVAKATWTYGAKAQHDIFDIGVGLFVLMQFLFIGFLAFKDKAKGDLLALSTFIVGFVVLQGLFGMWTVTLKVWPQVVTLHLLGGFTVVSLFFLLALRAKGGAWQFTAQNLHAMHKLKKWAALGIVVLFLQIALGGWTTSNYAAVACPDLPTCQGEMWPEANFAKGFNIIQEIGPNYLGGQMENSARVAIHLSHRIGAIITTVVLLLLLAKLIAIGQQTTRLGLITAGVLLLQVGLGLSNIIFHFPLSVAVLHNGVGALLLLCLVAINYRVQTATLGENHG